MEAAADRKARLKALKEAAASAEHSQTSTSAPSAQADEPVLKFRNYAVKDTRIEHQTIEAAQAPEYQEPVPEPSIVQEIQGEGDVLLNVVPKKANWDLRRDVEKKLAKLERRTQRALVQLMQEQQREQLTKDGGQAD
ncbi:probable coiled-coil domain-containing protein 12 [Coccomyxa sp. Obi]|nr:probable coiled-coil domain-containing protein 12 [Coccomyxa sp. Obi]